MGCPPLFRRQRGGCACSRLAADTRLAGWEGVRRCCRCAGDPRQWPVEHAPRKPCNREIAEAPGAGRAVRRQRGDACRLLMRPRFLPSTVQRLILERGVLGKRVGVRVDPGGGAISKKKKK